MSSSSIPIAVTGSFDSLSSPSHLHLALAQVYPSDYVHPEYHNGTSGQGEEEADFFTTGLAKLTAYARKAAAEGADVVVFPEYFLHGAKIDTWYGVRTASGPRPHKSRFGGSGGASGSGGQNGSAEVGENVDDEEEAHWLDSISSLAKELDINIVAGTVVELGHHVPHRADKEEEEGEAKKEVSLFNTAYFIGREGEVRGSYTKQCLWHPERAPLTPGHPSTHPSPDLFTFSTRRGLTLTTAMRICWDLAFPEAFRKLLVPPKALQTTIEAAAAPSSESATKKLKLDTSAAVTSSSSSSHSSPPALTGPDIIFCPTCWYATDAGAPGLKWNPSPTGEAAILDALTLTRALECESLLAMANIAGPAWSQADSAKSPEEIAKGDPIGVGRSTIVSPFLGSLARLDGPGEGMLLASVDMAILKDARDVYKIREDLAKAE